MKKRGANQRWEKAGGEGLRLRLRLMAGGEIALGPGKAELLGLIREHRSISAAARRMGMSYMRAWSLIQTMNRVFGGAVVETSRGGDEHGGAVLSALGKELLLLYVKLEEETLRATQETRRKIQKLARRGEQGRNR